MTTDLKTVKLTALHPADDNPRGPMDPTELKELAASITSVGILEPIIVTPNGKGYETSKAERLELTGKAPKK
jgi:ParB-like chromosome segregation protein Spo0J